MGVGAIISFVGYIAAVVVVGEQKNAQVALICCFSIGKKDG